jgi:hypothetical protein
VAAEPVSLKWTGGGRVRFLRAIASAHGHRHLLAFDAGRRHQLHAGGLGGSEAAMILLLSACAAPSALAVSATLLIRLTTLWFAVFLGVVALSVRLKNPRLRRLLDSG